MPTDPTASNGLSSAEASERLHRAGPNALPGDGPRSLLHITRNVLIEPMFLLLLAAAGIYILLGETREAIALSTSLLVVIAITILQERRTEHALSKLRVLSGTRALVIRDGNQVRIPATELVVDDIILLSEGDRVPADGRLLSASALSADESVLTGESLAVDKTAADATAGAASNVYSGTLITRGYGMARITATGASTELGKIGHALVMLQPEVTPLFREVRLLVRWVAGAGLLLCAAIAVTYALTRYDWLGGVLAGITVAMGVLPEEFPVVLTVFLAMGAWRISRSGVLTRRMPAIESIGAATVLAVDKTGTLTENRMRVAVIDNLQQRIDLRQEHGDTNADATTLDAAASAILITAMAASERDAFDPMEHAIHEAARRFTPGQIQRYDLLQLVREYDLTPELLAVTHVWLDGATNAHEVAVKGAPETVFALCKLDAEMRRQLLNRVAGYAQDGLRVLAVACGAHDTENHVLPDTPHGYALRLLGLICLADPLRADVPAVLQECTQAGIRVVMITGDHVGTALAIARQAGIDVQAGALSGTEVSALSTSELQARVRRVNVYARMTPEHKLLLVQALKANDEVVVMTGDGVNDAPALKAAHVGVAMGQRGTEVAREAASLVLLNDDFGSLVSAVRLGRRIYDNIRHAMSFIIAAHIPIAGLGLLPVLFGWPLLLFPLHVMFLEFVVDPACSFVFEADDEAADVMQRKPRPAHASLFTRHILIESIVRGTLVLLAIVTVYLLALKYLPLAQARALAFVALVAGTVLLIFISRSHAGGKQASSARPNQLFWWISGITLCALLMIIYLKPIATLFGFVAPPLVPVLVLLLITLLIVITGLRGSKPSLPVTHTI